MVVGSQPNVDDGFDRIFRSDLCDFIVFSARHKGKSGLLARRAGSLPRAEEEQAGLVPSLFSVAPLLLYDIA